MAEEAEQDRGGERPPRTEIIVNGRKKTVRENSLSFEELVALAFEKPPAGENVSFVITYDRGPKQNPKGTMSPGQKVKIRDGMIFNVRHTDKS